MSVMLAVKQSLLKKPVKLFLNLMVLGMGFACSALLQADEGPYVVVQKTANDLVAALTADPAKLKDNPAAYEKIVNDILVPVVDFATISKHVMGKTHYLAATPEQRGKFEKVFQASLVSTYSTGLAIFDSKEIKVLDPEPGTETQDIQSVNMEVKTSDGTIFPLRFTMRKDDAGAWKVVNVIINGVNVAKAYNSHFTESITKYGGDIEQLIANWNAKIEPESKPISQ